MPRESQKIANSPARLLPSHLSALDELPGSECLHLINRHTEVGGKSVSLLHNFVAARFLEIDKKVLESGNKRPDEVRQKRSCP